MQVSRKALDVKPSSTLAISAKAKQLKANGKDVIDFSAGEPDFPTPDYVCDAARQAIAQGRTKYTATPGIPELRAAIANRVARDYGFTWAPEKYVVTSGAKHAIYLALLALVNPGDEVLIPAPYWVSYPPQVTLCDAVPVILPTKGEDGFLITPTQLRAAITPRSRVLILNSPSNPTGAVYSRAQLEALADVVKETGLVVICDDIYEKLIYDGAAFASMAQIERVRSQCVLINGVSKCASMPGWRIGYVGAEDEAVVKAITRLQGQMTSHATSISQYAALAALSGTQPELTGWVAEFEARRNRICQLFNEIPGLSISTPGGAFYAFVDWRGQLGREIGGRVLIDDAAWADYLLDEALVAAVPGAGFGAPGYMRFSFALALSDIERGLARIKEAMK